MKSVLRNQTSTNLGTFAGALIAAIALNVTGCSGAESNDLDAPLASSSDAVEAASDAVSDHAEPAVTEKTNEAETPATAATTSPTSPRGHSPGRAPTESAPTGSPSAAPTDEPAAAPSPEPVHSNTMRVSGRQLLDSCGQPFVVRGVEQILGNQLPEGNDWLGIVREIASTGANAVRILPGVNTLTLDDIDEVLTFIGEQGMVAFIDPLNGPEDWYAQDDVRAMLKKHESFLIIDAYGEPQYDDVEQWRAEAKDALIRMRALGYEVPFTVYANQFGRGLPSLFDYGAEILAADPLHNTFLGWQAYWGDTGYYQEHYGYSLSEAVDAIVDSGLPIQMGLDHITDLPSTQADFSTLMQSAQANGVGWLWWDFYNPYGSENNLSQDGSADNLTVTGAAVLQSHAASVSKTAKLTCGR
jgi:mannan endo-1,4-beta-mannosidase